MKTMLTSLRNKRNYKSGQQTRRINKDINFETSKKRNRSMHISHKRIKPEDITINNVEDIEQLNIQTDNFFTKAEQSRSKYVTPLVGSLRNSVIEGSSNTSKSHSKSESRVQSPLSQSINTSPERKSSLK